MVSSVVVVLLKPSAGSKADRINAGVFIGNDCESFEESHGNSVNLYFASTMVNDLTERNHSFDVVSG